MGRKGAAQAKGLCVRVVWMGTCGCAARAKGLCVRVARVDGDVRLCCTGKGSLHACWGVQAYSGWDPRGTS